MLYCYQHPATFPYVHYLFPLSNNNSEHKVLHNLLFSITQ